MSDYDNNIMKAEKVRITKGYLIEICDKDGRELDSDFNFCSYRDAKQRGEKMRVQFNANEAILKQEMIAVDNDGCYLIKPISPNLSQRQLIITKEAFIECYNKWIKESEEE